jgi:hypothetical protein
MFSTLSEKYKRFKFTYNPVRSNDIRIRYYECKNTYDFDMQIFKPIIRVEYDKRLYNTPRESKYIISFRNTSNWKNCLSTGLVRFGKSWLFDGNISKRYEDVELKQNGKHYENPRHFVLVQFSRDALTIVVDIFEGFYPYKSDFRQLFIKYHKTYFKLDEIKKRAV